MRSLLDVGNCDKFLWESVGNNESKMSTFLFAGDLSAFNSLCGFWFVIFISDIGLSVLVFTPKRAFALDYRHIAPMSILRLPFAGLWAGIAGIPSHPWWFQRLVRPWTFALRRTPSLFCVQSPLHRFEGSRILWRRVWFRQPLFPIRVVGLASSCHIGCCFSVSSIFYIVPAVIAIVGGNSPDGSQLVSQPFQSIQGRRELLFIIARLGEVSTNLNAESPTDSWIKCINLFIWNHF